MNILFEVKGACAREGLTLTQAIEKWNEKYNGKQKIQNVSNKFKNETIRFKEIQELLDSIGYDLQVNKRAK